MLDRQVFLCAKLRAKDCKALTQIFSMQARVTSNPQTTEVSVCDALKLWHISRTE